MSKCACPKCGVDLTRHYELSYRAERSDQVKKSIALFFVVMVVVAMVTTFCISAQGCGGGGGGGSSDKTAGNGKIQIEWDHPESGPVDYYRVYVLRASGGTRVYEVRKGNCWNGNDKEATMVWVTSVADEIESEPSDIVQLPCFVR